MQKNQDADKCKLDILDILEKHIPLKYKEIGKSVSKLIKENRIMIKYSKFYEKEENYWFGIPEKKIKKFSSPEKSFVLLLLGCKTKTKEDKNVIVLPTTYLSKFLENVRTADDGSWKIKIYSIKNDAGFKISATDTEEEVSDYLNRFDLIRDESPNSNEQDAFSEEIFEEDKY
jgi:hypothetical protein